MATISLYLDTRKPLDGGACPLKLRVWHKNSGFYIPLEVRISPEHWDSVTREVVGHHRKTSLNSFIKRQFIKYEDKLFEILSSGELNQLTTKELQERMTGSLKLTQKSFKEYAEYFSSTHAKPGTQRLYKETLSAISKFTDIDKLKFEDINPAWLREFDRFLTNNGRPSANSRGILMRNIRAIFNDAINNDEIGLELYPFRKFKIRTEATVKRSLTVEELRELRDYPCEVNQQKWKDTFMLIFYLIGINVTDLLSIETIKDNRIEYRRAKTYKLYNIKLEPEAQEILNKYRGCSRLLNFSENYKDPRDFIRRLNANLQNIGPYEWILNASVDHPKKNKKKVNSVFPKITSYWARHTWATIAASLDIPKETIAAALGHGGNSVTDIYINFDQRKVDEANRKVIDYVNSACGWIPKCHFPPNS